MLKTCRNYALSAVVLIALFVAGCDINDSEVEQPAQAQISASFTEAESGDAITDAQVEVDAVYEGETQPVNQGIVNTDEDGSFEGMISNPNEIVITTLIFTLDYNDEEYVFEEEVNLELTREEPFDTESFDFVVDTSADDSGDEE